MTIKGIIFDFDGLIVDTETPELKAWHELFQSYQVDFSFEEYSKFIGMVYDDTSPIEFLQSKRNIKLDKNAVFEKFKQRKYELIDQEPLCAGVLDYLRMAQQIGLKIGLASSAKREWVDRHIIRLRIAQYFDYIYTLDDVTHPKPDPELYKLTVSSMGILPEETIALEDSTNGIASAKAAGLIAVAVPNSVTRAFDFSQADLKLDQLSEMPLNIMIDYFQVNA